MLIKQCFINLLKKLTECYIEAYRAMGEIDPTCTTPETLTMNVSMKLKDYRNCQNISDFTQVKNAVTQLIYSKEFLDRCKGMYVEHGITRVFSPVHF